MRNVLVGMLALAASALSGPGLVDASPLRWPISRTGRIEAVAIVQTLNATLLAARSATFTLERWCADHRMAEDAKLVATQRSDIDKPASAETRARLEVGPDEPVRYRRVLLSCGSHVLSEADNWYVPGRLMREMNRLLDTTSTPFGRAVADLQPFRRTVAAETLWNPLEPGWDRQSTDTSCQDTSQTGTMDVPPELFRHRAGLYDPQGRPFSEVVETYGAAVLDFPRGR